MVSYSLYNDTTIASNCWRGKSARTRVICTWHELQNKRICGFTETYNDAVLFWRLSCKMSINNRLWWPERGYCVNARCKQAKLPGRFWLNRSMCVCSRLRWRKRVKRNRTVCMWCWRGDVQEKRAVKDTKPVTGELSLFLDWILFSFSFNRTCFCGLESNRERGAPRCLWSVCDADVTNCVKAISIYFVNGKDVINFLPCKK